MKISQIPRERFLEVVVEGRLDATWAGPLLDALRGALRNGHHQIRLDALALEYLSSAGIRSLLQIHRELQGVQGSFRIRRATPFVVETLTMSGFGQLLESGDEDQVPAVGEAGMAESKAEVATREGVNIECMCLSPDTELALQRVGKWHPWQPVTGQPWREVAFPEDRLALGIGAPGGDGGGVRERLGEFLSAAGCVAYLPGDGCQAPDYLVAEEQYVPRLALLDGLVLEGDFSHLLRFAPAEQGARLPLGSLVGQALDSLRADAAGFVMIAEVEGLVGASLSRSPGLIDAEARPADFPEIRDWLAFCGERAHRSEQALVVGAACRQAGHPLAEMLPAVPSAPGLHCHAHAAVFPFRPLPQGRIESRQWVRKLFETGAPKAIMHLLEDDRPLLGLGQSAFVRGACWCAPLKVKEDLDI